MSNITPYTDAIKNARYGEEVRGSIVSALEKVNDDNESYIEIKGEIEDIYDDLTYRKVITLSAASWANKTQTVTCTGVLADQDKQLIEIVPNQASIEEYVASKIYCSAQGADSLTFKVGEGDAPQVDLTVYVFIRMVYGGTIDTALSPTSTNAVQNKVVYAAIYGQGQSISGLTSDVEALDGRLDTAESDITTLGGKVEDDEGNIETLLPVLNNNIPLDSTYNTEAVILDDAYVYNNGTINWAKLWTAPSDGYLMLSVADGSKQRMVARVYPKDFTSDIAVGYPNHLMPTIEAGYYNKPENYTYSTCASIFIRKGMKVGIFLESDPNFAGVTPTLSWNYWMNPDFTEMGHPMFFPIAKDMLEEE